MPPIAPIEEWVQRKYRDFVPAGRTKSGKARRVKPGDKRTRQVAWAIARKIERHGIKPAPFLIPAFNDLAPTLPQRLRESTARKIAALNSAA
jgi:hypothetical protein